MPIPVILLNRCCSFLTAEWLLSCNEDYQFVHLLAGWSRDEWLAGYYDWQHVSQSQVNRQPLTNCRH